MIDSSRGRKPQFRYERFGGILAMHAPRGLAYVDRAYARSLGYEGSPLWEAPAEPLGRTPLSAPTEVHLVLSQRCSAGCTGCYVDATPSGAAFSEADAKRALERLAAMGVFHVALGGGEAVDLPYLLEVARHARRLGITPNLTTAGLAIDESFAREAAGVFGQVNVSLDGLRDDYRASRGFDGFPAALRGLERLRAHSRHIGINCVVSRQNADHLAPLVALARKLKLSEVEFLRFKPAGRGTDDFPTRDLTPQQAKRLYPRALWYTVRYRMRIKLDCSFGGPDEGKIGEGPTEAALWREGFSAFRDYAKRAPEPCASCPYLSLCRGGCRVVSQAKGDWWQPDPGCPRVQAPAESQRGTKVRLPVLA